jgi:hypothetical protein
MRESRPDRFPAGGEHAAAQSPVPSTEGLTAMRFPSLSLPRQLATGIAAIGALALAPAAIGAAQATPTTVVCTNPASHASWRIRIDLRRGTVDANPARISAATISWHDRTDGRNYTLDRKSGELTVIGASSTGGYFLHYRCELHPLPPGS